MKKITKQLRVIFFMFCLLEVGFVLCYETGIILEGGFSGMMTAEFLTATVMELLTIIVIPVALKMIKYGAVRNVINREGEAGYYRMARCRMFLLLIPMLANTLCYYLFMNVAFAYMAIVLAISLVFIYPTENRSITEAGMED